MNTDQLWLWCTLVTGALGLLFLFMVLTTTLISKLVNRVDRLDAKLAEHLANDSNYVKEEAGHDPR